MDKQAEYITKQAFKVFFRVFRTDVSYRKWISHDQNKIYGGFISKNRSYGKWHSVCEPIGSNESNSNQLENVQNATANQYTYKWFSHQNVPVKTQVKVKKFGNRLFTVIAKADHTEMFGCYEYTLKGRSDINEKV